MSGHTPGPWGSQSNGIYRAETGAIHGGRTCAECGHDPTECGDAVFVAIAPDLIDDIKAGHWDDVEPLNTADMILAAAAPELLEACKQAESAISEHDPFGTDLLGPLRVAIAKATGGES